MRWTDEEILILKNEYEKYGGTYLSKKLNRNPRSIGSQAKRIGLKFNSSYFYESVEFDMVIKNSKNFTDVCRNLGLKITGGNRNTIKKWVEIKKIDTSHFFIKRSVNNIKIDLDDILVENSSYRNLFRLKERLYKSEIKKRECELCGQGEKWMDKKISLILDHINGINNDNRIENLRIVCPNCNATLDTHGGKNIKFKIRGVA